MAEIATLYNKYDEYTKIIEDIEEERIYILNIYNPHKTAIYEEINAHEYVLKELLEAQEIAFINDLYVKPFIRELLERDIRSKEEKAQAYKLFKILLDLLGV